MTPYEARERMITASSCQKDAIEIVKTRRALYKKAQVLKNEDLIKEVQKVRDKLFDNLVKKYGSKRDK